MSDSFQSFALLETDAGNATTIAAQLSDWLVARGIIRKGATDAPPDVAGFSPGTQAEEVLTLKESGWRDIAFTDVHVDSNRCVTTAIQGGLGPVFCPACQSPMGSEEDIPSSFMQAVEEWDSGQEGILTCPACESSAPITKWRTEPFWAFGHVTITFWNWPPISDTFVPEVESVAGRQVKVVRGKL